MGVRRRDRDVLGEATVAFASDETGLYKSFFPSTVERIVDDYPLADARLVYASADHHDATDNVRTLYPGESHRISPMPAARDRRVFFRSVRAFSGPDVGIVYPGGTNRDQDLALGRFGSRHVLPVVQLLYAAMAGK
jgi:hypothetical protein